MISRSRVLKLFKSVCVFLLLAASSSPLNARVACGDVYEDCSGGPIALFLGSILAIFFIGFVVRQSIIDRGFRFGVLSYIGLLCGVVLIGKVLGKDAAIVACVVVIFVISSDLLDGPRRDNKDGSPTSAQDIAITSRAVESETKISKIANLNVAAETPARDPAATIREVSTFSTFNEWAIDPETRELYSELSGESLDLGREDGYTIVGQYYLLHSEPITRKLHKNKVEIKTRKPPTFSGASQENIFAEYFRLRGSDPAKHDGMALNGSRLSEASVLKLSSVQTFEYTVEWFIDPYTLELYNELTEESLIFGVAGGYAIVGSFFVLANQTTPRRLSFSKVGRKPRKATAPGLATNNKNTVSGGAGSCLKTPIAADEATGDSNINTNLTARDVGAATLQQRKNVMNKRWQISGGRLINTETKRDYLIVDRTPVNPSEVYRSGNGYAFHRAADHVYINIYDIENLD